MKQTLLTTAITAGILFGFSGSALAVNDGFFVEGSVHPDHKDVEISKHSVWIQKVADGTHTYELRIEDGEITVVVDGDQVPEKRIKKENNAVVILKNDGGVLYEFELEAAIHNADFPKKNKPSLMVVRGDSGVMAQWIIGKSTQIADERVFPKVMLGIYSDEASDPIRKQLRIKGRAILVDSVIQGLSADKAGMKDHDIIISIDGSDGVSPADLTKILGQHKPGDEIKIVVIRNGEKLNLGTKLHAYDARALGHVAFSEDGGQWSRLNTISGTVSTGPKNIDRFLSPETQERAHAKIIRVLRDQGIDDEKIVEIEAKIMESLDENVWSVFGDDGATEFRLRRDGGAANVDQSKRQYLVESMQKKAEQAMRDAERLTMEFKDGQLLLKRHVDRLEGHFSNLPQRIHEHGLIVEEELEGRLGELEERLDELESMLDSRMESLTGLIERLIDRLDED